MEETSRTKNIKIMVNFNSKKVTTCSRRMDSEEYKILVDAGYRVVGYFKDSTKGFFFKRIFFDHKINAKCGK